MLQLHQKLSSLTVPEKEIPVQKTAPYNSFQDQWTVSEQFPTTSASPCIGRFNNQARKYFTGIKITS